MRASAFGGTLRSVAIVVDCCLVLSIIPHWIDTCVAHRVSGIDFSIVALGDLCYQYDVIIGI